MNLENIIFKPREDNAYEPKTKKDKLLNMLSRVRVEIIFGFILLLLLYQVSFFLKFSTPTKTSVVPKAPLIETLTTINQKRETILEKRMDQTLEQLEAEKELNFKKETAQRMSILKTANKIICIDKYIFSEFKLSDKHIEVLMNDEPYIWKAEYCEPYVINYIKTK